MPEQKVSTITNEDVAIVSLKTLITELNLQSNQLTSQISNFSDAVKNGIMMRNRLSAMRALRSKKMAEQSLARKLKNLSQLEAACDRIEQAADQVALIAVLKSTTRVLRGLHSKIGDVADVENVMEELKTELLKSDHISDALNEAGQEASAVDDEAIEAELELLIHHADLIDNDMQIRDVAARLDSVSSAGNVNFVVDAQKPRKPSAVTISTGALPNQGDLLETGTVNSMA